MSSFCFLIMILILQLERLKMKLAKLEIVFQSTELLSLCRVLEKSFYAEIFIFVTRWKAFIY